MKMIDSRLAARSAAGLLVLAGLTACASAADKAPRPTVTQVEQAADDALLATAVKATLIGVDVDSTASLGVRVEHGVATLTGTVRSAADRAKDAAAARSVKGIRAVRDELRIDPRLPDVGRRVGDAALAGRITAAIFTETGSTAVHVGVRDGVVTLRGDVTDPKVRAAALAAARNTGGVRRVVDELRPGT